MMGKARNYGGNAGNRAFVPAGYIFSKDAMKIAFHVGHLNLRGTTVALYDFARFNRSLLKNESIILANKNDDLSDRARFESLFPVFLYDQPSEIDAILKRENVDAIYWLKEWRNDGLLSKTAKNLVHCISGGYDPHGDVYAYISKWSSDFYAGGKAPYVPLIVDLPPAKGNLRAELGIPAGATVFGRHGGASQFSIRFVRRAVIKTARRRKNVYFLFLNTNRFNRRWPNKNLRNIIYLPPTVDPGRKVAFINTCDAMLHGREQGEAFGLAVAEFLHQDRPVMTWDSCREMAHVADLLRGKAILYHDYKDVYCILNEFKPLPRDGAYKAQVEEFQPEAVMEKFKKVFLGF
jgi:hypothetical protein